ncbi:cell surface protein [Companilactobacillus sp. RD055328]|uniref:DUF916 and DUF3324 domain-containing protein n=1 Tax=Companilactobacillus sp. RD055328 TaxID=2916634 RepID=UPI001FC7F9AB|nr:DUF916 and DUF3324 domain-containing protein [Companilactobacillus sp. RD055328]GKQ43300.1 cell surface protein [Companilactobacillus sp. RD055328]
MKKKNLFTWALAVTMLMIGSLVTPTVSAADANSNPDMAYSVKANIPDNQVDKKLTYFDLQLNPGQQQDISISLTNSSKETSTFNVNAIHASTNKNGVIDYSNAKVKKDKSFKYDWNKIITNPKQTVTLAPGETKNVTFHIVMPEKGYKGIILGGFHIQKQVADNRASEKGVMIRNRFAYIIGLSLQNESTAVIPDLKLNKVKPTLDNSYTTITANLQNPTKTIIHKFNVTAKIYKKGSNQVLYTTTKKDMGMAPNSNFDFPIDLNHDPIKPGKYTAKIHATSEGKKYVWNLGGDFEIKADKADKLNKDAVVLNKDWTWLWILLGVIALILVGVIVWLIMALKKRNKDDEDKK